MIQEKGGTHFSFNTLKTLLNLESNRLSYHLRILRSHDIIRKNDVTSSYELTQKGKILFPYLPIITQEQRPALVVCSIAVLDGEYIYLRRKPREPHKGKLCLLGEKVLDDQTIEETAKAVLQKTGFESYTDLRLRCINECIKTDEDNKSILFHDVVYFFTAQAHHQDTTQLLRMKRSTLEKDDLFWDNWFLITQMLNTAHVQVTTTRY